MSLLPTVVTGHLSTVLPTYRIFPFSNGFWPQNTTPKNSVSCNGINYIPPLNVRRVFFFNTIFCLSFPVLCWTLLTLSPSHPPLWRIDLPMVERRKKRKKKENERYRLDSERTHMIALVSCQASTLLDIGNV